MVFTDFREWSTLKKSELSKLSLKDRILIDDQVSNYLRGWNTEGKQRGMHPRLTMFNLHSYSLALWPQLCFRTFLTLSLYVYKMWNNTYFQHCFDTYQLLYLHIYNIFYMADIVQNSNYFIKCWGNC